MEEKQQVQEYESRLGAEMEGRSTTSLDSIDCFHGFITEEEAEYRLRECKIDGALILHAEQNSVKPKFHLSWLPSTNNSVKHFS
ncbi:unnamed protein product [Onchocerca flexuosa]|uniref:RRM domain-containing protein n=1 Tax=Onchocerca flexuosa TaxID=387005 RepID=A0A183HUI0_9BILA|nr:unnamed protein product [Onchocerca flexuosa]